MRGEDKWAKSPIPLSDNFSANTYTNSVIFDSVDLSWSLLS